jgi:hypothetical protein
MPADTVYEKRTLIWIFLKAHFENNRKRYTFVVWLLFQAKPQKINSPALAVV